MGFAISNKVIFVVGPTAVGKTRVGIGVAKKFDGEVISADSMQIYKGFRIGTSAPTEEEMGGVVHHMIGTVDPSQAYNVAAYQKEAKKIISSVIASGKVPVVVGGTGLYINSLTHDLDFSTSEGNETLRKKLSERYDKYGAKYMFEVLKKHDPAAAARVHANDKKRIVRELEIIENNEKRITHNFNKYSPDYDCILIGLEMQRQTLVERINMRVDEMMEQGLEQEVFELIKQYGPGSTCFQAIGYKEFIPYFLGKQTLEDTSEQIKRRTIQYSKRQMTWFRRDERIKWFTATNKFLLADIYAYIRARFSADNI